MGITARGKKRTKGPLLWERNELSDREAQISTEMHLPYHVIR